jgi:hypothetical protein
MDDKGVNLAGRCFRDRTFGPLGRQPEGQAEVPSL